MISNILKGPLCVNPNRAGPRHIPQTQWKCPLKITLDSNWSVAAGDESTEAVAQRRDTTDPRPSAPLCKASDHSDSKTPVIPLSPIEVEEEGSLQNDSSAAFLTTPSTNLKKQKEVLKSGTPVTHNFISPESVKHTDVEMSGHNKLPAMGVDVMSHDMAGAAVAAAALIACASRQDEQTPIDIGLLLQFLSNPDTVRKFISEQSVPGIEQASMLNKPTLSVPFVSSNPGQLNLNMSENCVRANTGMVISKPNAWTSSVPSQSSRPIQDVIDLDLLVRLLKNPKDIEKLIKDYDDKSGNLSTSVKMKAAVDQSLPSKASTPESSLSFFRENTVNESSSVITGAPFSAPQKIFSSVFTASTKMSSKKEDSQLPDVTMAPMSPLYSSPSDNLESDMKIERVINEGGIADEMRMDPGLKTSLISPVVSFSLPQTELSEFPRASLQPTPNVLQSPRYMNPLRPEIYLHPVLGVSAPIPMPGTELVTLPKANARAAANMRHLPSAFGHSTPFMRVVAPQGNHENCLNGIIGHGGTQRISDYDFVSLRGNTQVVGQGPSMLKPQKPCIFFNTPKGCWNGTNCRYLHIRPDEAAPSRVEALPNAKRMKLGSETSGWLNKERYMQ